MKTLAEAQTMEKSELDARRKSIDNNKWKAIEAEKIKRNEEMREARLAELKLKYGN